jgi:hypothetical protein
MASEREVYVSKKYLGCRETELLQRRLRAAGDDFRAAELRYSALSGQVKKFLATYDVDKQFLTFAGTVCFCVSGSSGGGSSSSSSNSDNNFRAAAKFSKKYGFVG